MPRSASTPRPRHLALALAASLPGGALAGPNLTEDLAKERSSRVSNVEYEMHLDLDQGSATYEGRTVVRFGLRSKWRDLHLDFQGETILALEVNGKTIAAPRFEDFKIWLPKEALRVGTNAVAVRYQNHFDTDGAGLHKVVDPADGREYLYTDFEPYDANRVWPCFDQPDLKATYALTVAAPKHWSVVSNGRLLSTRDEGDDRIRTYATLPRFSTYIFALCAGPFAHWKDPYARIPSRVFCTQSMAEHMDADEIFSITRKGFRFFQRYFEIPYPFEKYDQVFLPQFNSGAMENVACVTFNERYVYRHEPSEKERMGRANTILHEMAHMWFGDIVTMQWWNDLWLNESFATYMANLALVEATRFTDAWEQFATGTKGWAYWQDQLPTTHPIETPVPDTDTTFTNFDGITYGKGASVLKQLAFYVGEDAFREGVSEYLKENRWKNATRADFMGAIAEAADQDLDRWTKLWLRTSGVNTLRPRVQVERGRIRTFFVDQEPGNGDSVLRPHRLQVALYRLGEAGELEQYAVESVLVQGRSTEVPALEGKAAPDFVDANHGDHAYAKVFLDDGSLGFAMERLEALPSAFLRGNVWKVMWFMVRDAAILPTAYLDLVLEKAGVEEDDKILSNIFGWQLSSALDAYLPSGLRARYAARLQDLAWREIRAAPAGSDLQKAWFDALRVTARSPEALARLRRLLDGALTLPGFPIDQEKRWEIVTQLCAHGHPEAAALLEAERGRDATERGKISAFAAWVAQPDPGVKEEAWATFLDPGTDKPLSHLRAGMRTFFQTHQEELLRPYVDRYFTRLPEVEKTRDTYYVRTFVGRLFPGELVSHRLLERSRAMIEAHPGWPYYVRRSLLESNDELERALKVRATLRP